MGATYTELALAGPVAVPTSEGVAYTAPSSGIVNVTCREMIFANTTGSTVTVGVSILRAGASAGSGNRIVPDGYTVDPNGVAIFDLHQVLNPGDKLSWKASGSGITGSISGLERVT